MFYANMTHMVIIVVRISVISDKTNRVRVACDKYHLYRNSILILNIYLHIHKICSKVCFLVIVSGQYPFKFLLMKHRLTTYVESKISHAFILAPQ